MGDILQVTGLYNRAPQFKFARRDSMVLSIQVEATTEEDLLKGLNHVTIVLCLQPFSSTTCDGSSMNKVTYTGCEVK
ncbi:hypothetical protein Bca101_096254 [Brassica carinata]